MTEEGTTVMTTEQLAEMAARVDDREGANENRNDEREDEKVVELPRFVAGDPLPEDFINPPAGDVNHKCLDPRGNYQPKWAQLRIAKGANLSKHQIFNCAGKMWHVAIGGWVDVPPEVINVLGMTDQEVISMDIENANPLVDKFVPTVVDIVPRFNWGSRASA